MKLHNSFIDFGRNRNKRKDETPLQVCSCQLSKLTAHTEDLQLFDSLPPSHIIRTMILEHARIHAFLDELNDLYKQIKPMNTLADNPQISEKLRYLVDHLLRSERHHIREENVIIRRLDKLKVFVPGTEIRKQHDTLRVRKRKLENLLYDILIMDFTLFKKEAKKAISKITDGLREHIILEDTVLFSTALKHIPEKEWEQMKIESDSIGYCCFTPPSTTSLIRL